MRCAAGAIGRIRWGVTSPLEQEDAPTADVPDESSPLHNPYAAPTFVAPTKRRREVRTDLVAVAMIGTYVLLSLAAAAADAFVLGGESTNDGGPPRVVAAALGLAWFGRRWARIPPEAQHAVAGKRIGPWLAVLFHFLPGFNFFWLFKAQTALRDGVNQALRKSADSSRIPRDPAIVAPLIYLGALIATRPLRTSWLYLVPVTLSPAAWTLHMGLIERAWAQRRKAFG
jgi:hypothetical protein